MTEAEHIHDSTRVIACSHVVDEGLPVLQIVHEQDGDWQFLCGGDDHTRSEQVRFACWSCMTERDPSLEAANGLWLGYTITRQSVAHTWDAAPNAKAEQ